MKIKALKTMNGFVEPLNNEKEFNIDLAVWEFDRWLDDRDLRDLVKKTGISVIEKDEFLKMLSSPLVNTSVDRQQYITKALIDFMTVCVTYPEWSHVYINR